MSVENLTRYRMVHSPAGYSDFIQMCDKGECGEYVKFEEAKEASSKSLRQLKAEITAIAEEMVSQCTDGASVGAIRRYAEKLRQLSAI